MSSSTQVYVDILRSYISDQLSPEEFEARYLAAFKADASFHDEPTYEALNSLFRAVDAYCGDGSLRGPGDIGPSELLAAARRALATLDMLSGERRE